MYESQRNLHFPAHTSGTGSANQGDWLPHSHLSPACPRYLGRRLMLVVLLRSAVTYTGNITISCACSNTAAFLPKLTTSSSATTLTEASSPLRPSACSWPTRSNTLRISSSYGATTSVRLSTGSTASTMNVRGGTTSSYGRRSRTVSTVCQSQPSSMRRSSPCMEA